MRANNDLDFTELYRVIDFVKQTPTSEILKVFDKRRRIPVALKRVRKSRGESPAYLRKEFAELTYLDHPNVVKVYDYGEAEDFVYYTMAYYVGRDITHVGIDRRDLPTIVDLAAQILAALDFVHRRGIVHGDIKPSNIFVKKSRPRDRYLLGDFGLLRVIGARSDHAISGTMEFIAPEIFRGVTDDPRSDLYSLGLLLFVLMAQRLPFHPGDDITSVKKKTTYEYLTLKDVSPDADPHISDFVVGLLTHNRADRFATAYEALLRLHDAAARAGVPIEYDVPISNELATGKIFGFSEKLETLSGILDGDPGGPHNFIIKGTRGSGKTTLIHELGKRTQLRGGRYSYVDCAAGLSAANPSGKRLVRRGGAPSGKHNLSHYDFGALIAGTLEGRSADSKRRTYDDATAAILPPDDGKLTFVAFDNLDTADADLVEAALGLARAAAGERVYFAFGCRQTPDPHDDVFEKRILANATKPVPCLTVELTGLEPAATEEFVKYLLGTPTVSSRLLEYVKDKSKGNPLTARNILETLTDEGVLTRRLSGWEVDHGRLDKVEISAKYSAYFAGILKRLKPNEARALRIAAAYGYSFPEGLIPSRDASSSLARRGVVKRTENGAGEYCFSDVEFWYSLVEHIRRAEEKEPFGAVVAYLEDKSALTSGELAIRGKAYAELGDADHARSDLRRAAAIAHEQADYETAVELLESALAAANGADADEGLLTSLADAYAAAGEYGCALDYYTKARTTCEPGDGNGARLTLNIARAQIGVGAHEEAIAELAALADEDLPLSKRFMASALTAWSYYRANDFSQAEAFAREAGDVASRTGRDDLTAYGEYLKGVIHLYGQKAYDLATAELSDAAALAAKTGDSQLAAAVTSFLGDAHVKRGEFKEAEKVLERTLEASRENGHGYNAALALLYLGNLSFWQGYVKRAEEYYREAATECQPLGNAQLLATAYLYSAANMIRAGEYHKAGSYFELIDRLNIELGAMEGSVHYHRASLYAEIGEPEKALRLLERAEADFDSRGQQQQTGSVKALRSRILYGLGRAGEAEAELRAGRELIAGSGDDFELGRFSFARAEHGLAVGNLEEAERYGRLAKTLFKKSAKYYHLAECYLLETRIYIQRWRLKNDPGDLARAERGLQRAKSLLNHIAVEKFRNDAFQLGSEISMAKRPRSEERNEVLLALTKHAKALAEQADLTSVLNYVLSFLTEELQADRGVVFLFDDFKNILRIKGTAGVDETTIRDASAISQTIVNQVAGSKQSVVSTDAQYDSRFEGSASVRLNRIRSLLCLPMTVSDRLLGVIYLDNLETDDLFQDDDLIFAEAFAQNAAYEIERRGGRSSEKHVSVAPSAVNDFGYDCLVGSSPEIKELKAAIEKAAANPINVLVVGESGTGKELVAKTVHYNGFNADKPFIGINCAALPETLLESELFGIEKGTATGVDKRIGRFEQAGEGTIFLDEIGAMDSNTQAKFLRVLQERQFERLGARGGDPIQLRARIISATNADLQRLIDDGTFRKDLYFRLNVFLIHVPPLRERKSDIPELCRHFIDKHYNGPQNRKPELSSETLESLYAYDWPGNVRELENCVQYAIVNTASAEIAPSSLPPHVASTKVVSDEAEQLESLNGAVAQLEREMILKAMRGADWVKARAAAMLGISVTNLRYKMKKYRVTEKDRFSLE